METQTSLLLVTALGLILYSVVSYFYHHFGYWQRQGVPGFRFMHFGWYRMPFSKFVEIGAQRFGRVYGAYNFVNRILIVNDARLARDISTKALHQFAIRNNQFHQGSTNITRSLFFIEANEDWKRIRSIVTPAFTSGKLRRMITPIERIADNFVHHLKGHSQSGDTFDLKHYVGCFAMDVIACCAYGIELNSFQTPNHPVVVNAKRILNVDITPSQLVCFLFPRLAKWLKLELFNREAVNYFDRLTFEIIEKRVKDAKINENSDLLGLMIDSLNDEKQNESKQTKGTITKDELSGQAILFFIAGFDTTHATFDHVVYYLCKHPEWQDKLFHELDSVRHQLDYDRFKALPVLNAVINETLRLHPPLTVVHREAVEDCDLLDTDIHIPAHTLISTQPYVVHRDPEYFPDPLTFKPERFLDRDNSAESHFAYMPFGLGARTCVGMRFAQNELRIGLAHLVLSYRLEMEPDFKLEYFNGSPLMSPKRLMVRISERG